MKGILRAWLDPMDLLLFSGLAQAAGESSSGRATTTAVAANPALNIVFQIALGIALLIGVALIAVIFFTGKGDAMSGGGGVRTNFKGKASFDDKISQWVLIGGATFMGLMVFCDVLLHKIN